MKKLKERNEILSADLINYNPVKNKINIPTKNYAVRLEDIVPALSGAIGKIALVAAFAIAWGKGLGISNPDFVAENVRLELIISSIFTIMFCAILNPRLAPPGTLAPFIPLVPAMAGAGVHPLILGILIGIIGLILSMMRFFNSIEEINGTAARGGIILLFGIMGITSSIGSLQNWTKLNNDLMFIALIILGVAVYLILNKINMKWLMIPSATVIGLLVPAIWGFYPEIKTASNFPILNPKVWWFDMWGLGWGFTIKNFAKALHFALLAVVMWPTDAVAIQTLQKNSYGIKSEKAVFQINSTFKLISIRNMIGSFLGGSQIAAVWRSFMIPLSIVRRPIGGSALLLGLLGIAFGIMGFPIDIATFPPMIWLVLLFGVYIPLLEIGFQIIKTPGQMQIAVLSIVVGLAVNPVIGWIIAIIVENFNVIKGVESEIPLNPRKLKMTLIVSIFSVSAYIISLI